MAHLRVSSGHLIRRAAAVGIALVLAAASIAFAGPASAQARPTVTPEERAAALVRPSVVFIQTFWAGFVYDEDGIYFNDGNAFEFSTSCTGFVVNPIGHIMTAGHCVDDSASFGGVKRDLIEIAAQEAWEEGTYEGAPPVEQLFEFGLANWTVEGPAKGSPVQREVFIQRGRAVSGERTGEALPARVVDFRSAESGDVALLKVEASDLPSVLVSDVNELEVGTPLLSVGYPGLTEGAVDESLEPTNKDGKISAKKTQGSYPVYEVSAAIASGMSGGPSVNMEGEVIGVNSFGIGDSEAFNFIVPAGNIREILARNGATNELGRTDTIYREGLTAFYAGRYTPAIGAFDRVLDLDPAHQQAQEYRQQAARARAEGGEVTAASEGGESSFPVVPVAVGAVVLLALVGGAFVMKGRKKPQGELPPAGATAGPAYQTPSPSPSPSYEAPQPTPTPTPTPTPSSYETSQPAPASASPVPPPPVAQPVTSQTPAPSPSPVSPPPVTESVPAGSHTQPVAATSVAASPQPDTPTDNNGESAPKPKFCPSCGTARASDTTQFCGNCGTKF